MTRNGPPADLKQGITRTLADFSAGLTYDSLPADVAKKVKYLVLDSLGVALAATTLGVGCSEAIDVIEKLGGKPEATILGRSQRVAAPHAAFANGALGHALNYDPIGREVGHVGIVCLAAPLAVAEAIGGISGGHFLAAVAAAAEVTSRVTAAIVKAGRKPSEKFLSGQILSYFGCAVGAGRVLGVSAQQMHSVFGLALMQAAGSMQMTREGDPPAKAIYGAFPNHAGVLAALLAKGDLGANVDALEGGSGIYEMLYGGEYDVTALAERLGTEFMLMKTQFKTWPTSLETYPFIDAAFQIGPRPAATIKQLTIHAPNRVRTWIEPVATRAKPPNPAAAANSIPFSVSKVLCNGSLTLADFTEAGIADRAVIALAERSKHHFDDRIKGSLVEIETMDGKTAKAEGLVHDGSDDAKTFGKVATKFKDCCRYSIISLSADRTQRLIDMVENLEQVSDVRELVACVNA